MAKFTLTRDGGKDIQLEGELIGEATSHHYQGSRNTRWQEIDIYRTAAGKLIVQRTHKTCWEGERDAFDVEVCPSLDEVMAFLTVDGELSDLAKEALKDAGLGEQTIETVA